MAAPLRKGRALAVQRLGGVTFLAVLALLVGLTIALYQRAFTPVVTVELRTDRVGNQLTVGADVKVRGLIVGDVRDVTATDEGASITLAIREELADQVARDVTARLLPKTLFGEKFVALTPAGTTREPVRDGDVITQDRSQSAFETAQAVDNLLPLLQTLKPAALSTTLNALSGALRGRGERLGDNLEATAAYLGRLNPALPTLERDLRGLADLSRTYADAAPDLLRLVEDLSVNARTLVDQRDELGGFLTATESMADELQAFTADNAQRLVALARDSVPVLQAYARYAPGFPCLLDGINDIQPEGERVFGGAQPGLHITLEVVRDNGGYLPDEQPVFGEDGGPNCFGLGLENAVRPFPVNVEVTDGYCDEEEQQPGIQDESCRGRGDPVPTPAADALARTLTGDDQVRLLSAPVYGAPLDEVPDIAALLFGPLARGAVVGYSNEAR